MSLSEYEQERQRNMERNRQMLVKLGLEKGDHSSLLVDDNKKQAKKKKQNVSIPRERSSRTAKKPALYGNGLTDEFFLSEERRDTKKVVETYLREQGKTFLDLKHDIHRLMESTGLSRDQVADYMQTERIRRRQQHATADCLERPVRRRITTVTFEEEFSDQLGPRKRHRAAVHDDTESLLYIKQQQIRNTQHQQRLQAHLQRQRQQQQIKEGDTYIFSQLVADLPCMALPVQPSIQQKPLAAQYTAATHTGRSYRMPCPICGVSFAVRKCGMLLQRHACGSVPIS